MIVRPGSASVAAGKLALGARAHWAKVEADDGSTVEGVGPAPFTNSPDTALLETHNGTGALADRDFYLEVVQ
jgi:hypothetical protein